MGPIPPSATVAESAVLILVPEAERAVSGHRDRLDRAATWGVPAHVTILPVPPPSAITATVITSLADTVGSVRAFDCAFAATGWFGEQAVWLAPRPDAPFRALTKAVSAAFPGYLPYGGAYDDVVPISPSGTDLPVALPNCGRRRRTCCTGCLSTRGSAVCG